MQPTGWPDYRHDQLVLQAMKNKDELAPLRAVVEKELLHHDIIREMGTAGFLNSLTFIGAGFYSGNEALSACAYRCRND